MSNIVKSFQTNPDLVQDSYGKEESSESEYYEVQHIVAHRVSVAGKITLLIKWKGYASRHNTWEPLDSFYKDA